MIDEEAAGERDCGARSALAVISDSQVILLEWDRAYRRPGIREGGDPVLLLFFFACGGRAKRQQPTLSSSLTKAIEHDDGSQPTPNRSQ